MRCAFALLLVQLAACGVTGGAADPGAPHVKWTYRLGPDGPGRPRSLTRPSIGPDGTIYAGGALEDGSNTACLHAIFPNGERRELLRGTVGDFRGAPSVWPIAKPDDTGAFAVDEEGGLYSLRFDGEHVFRAMPGDAFDRRLRKLDPKLLGPILTGDRGVVYSGGMDALYVLYIESRTTPVSLKVGARGHVHAGLGPSGKVFAVGDFAQTTDEDGNAIGLAYAPIEDGAGHVFDRYGGTYWSRQDYVQGPRGFRYELPEHSTSEARVGPDDTIYVTTSRSLYALDREGKAAWSFETAKSFHTEVAILEGTVYAVDSGGTLVAIASADGSERWQITLSPTCASPALSPDGTVYVSCEDGLLYAVSPPVS